MLIKPGVETHSYEPTPDDIQKIQNSDLFIYNGNTSEKEYAKDMLGFNRNLKIIDASYGIAARNEVKERSAAKVNSLADSRMYEMKVKAHKNRK